MEKFLALVDLPPTLSSRGERRRHWTKRWKEEEGGGEGRGGVCEADIQDTRGDKPVPTGAGAAVHRLGVNVPVLLVMEEVIEVVYVILQERFSRSLFWSSIFPGLWRRSSLVTLLVLQERSQRRLDPINMGARMITTGFFFAITSCNITGLPVTGSKMTKIFSWQH